MECKSYSDRIYKEKKLSFILTIWNVNKMTQEAVEIDVDTFILTIWNVNVVLAIGLLKC